MFKVNSREPKVIQGYNLASMAMSTGLFLNKLSAIKKFTYTSADGKVVANYLSDYLCGPVTQVDEYLYKSKSVKGTTFKGDPKIYVNSYNFGRFSAIDYLRNGGHEVGHKLGFGHGSNWTQDNWKGRLMCKINGDSEDKNLSVPFVMEILCLEVCREKGWL